MKIYLSKERLFICFVSNESNQDVYCHMRIAKYQLLSKHQIQERTQKIFEKVVFGILGVKEIQT